MPEHLLDSREVAAVLHVSRTYAYQLIQRGDIAAVRMGRSVRVRPRDLDEYVRRHAEIAGLRRARSGPSRAPSEPARFRRKTPPK